MGDKPANAMDMPAHVATYGSVMSLLKWGTVACVVIAAFVIWLIA